MASQSSANHIVLIKDDPAVAQSLRIGLEREGNTVAWQTSTIGLA